MRLRKHYVVSIITLNTFCLSNVTGTAKAPISADIQGKVTCSLAWLLLFVHSGQHQPDCDASLLQIAVLITHKRG